MHQVIVPFQVCSSVCFEATMLTIQGDRISMLVKVMSLENIPSSKDFLARIAPVTTILGIEMSKPVTKDTNQGIHPKLYAE